LVLSYIRKPIDDIRQACYSLIFSLTKHTWGIESILNTPGMTEFLLNRNLDDSKVGLEWKYMIIESMFKNSNFKSMVNLNSWHIYKTYLELGVFYKKVESQVAIKNMHDE